MENLENICRVCLNRGSRNIFEKSSSAETQFTIPPINDNVSSLDRLPEKLRYVTMLKIEECENLPKSMCDSCIIQLNVAYNLKKNAIQSDMKLRQYMIEYGIGVTSYTTCSINTVSVIHPTPMIMSAPSNSNVGSVGTAPKSTSTSTSTLTSTSTDHQPFPVLPLVIKEEPSDSEEMSDMFVETESLDDRLQFNGPCNRNGRTSTNASSNNNNSDQQSLTPLPSNSMVAVNANSLLLSSRDASDNEYLSAYMPTPSLSSSPSTPKTSSQSSPNKHKKTVSETNEPKGRATRQSNDLSKVPKTDTTKQISKNSKTKRDSQKTDITERVTRQNLKIVKDGGQTCASRTRGGSFTNKDYKSFYSMRATTPTDSGKKTNNTKRIATSAKVSSIKKQRTFSPPTANMKRKRSSL